jgi:hypothetical protein
MKNKFGKNDLIFYFQVEDFPKDLICKDVLIHSELIFNEEGEEPEISSTKKVKYSSCFILEDELEPKGKGGFKKGGLVNKQGFKPIPKPRDAWRNNQPEENTDFFDNFKGKTDEKQVEKFKRNLENSMSRENSISIENSRFSDHLQEGAVKVFTVKNQPDVAEVGSGAEAGSQSLTADNFFENADKIMGVAATQPVSTPSTSTTQAKPQIKLDPNPKVVNIDSLLKINEYLQYPKEENLWYIFHPVAKSAFGPLSSPNIKDMYESKMLDGQSEIRFIDIYNLKNKKPFAFFHLKDVEKPEFVDEIDISPLLKVAVAIKNSKIHSSHTPQSSHTSQFSHSVNAANTVNVEKPKEDKPKEHKEIAKEHKEEKKPIKETPQKIHQETKHVNEPLNLKPRQEDKKPVVIEESPIGEQDFFDSKSGSKKIKKVPKGKPVDLDVKLSKLLSFIYL